jgi:hypothetical protein
VISQIVEGQPRDPRELVPGFPEPLAKIIARAMAPRPADRYAHAQALAADLGAFAAAQHRDVDLDAALQAALRGLFDAPAASEPPWEPQPLPPGPVPETAAAGSSGERERFAPDADFSNDDITRPSVVMLSDDLLAATPEEAEAMIAAQVKSGEPAETPAWLSQRQQALSRAPADIFGPARREAGAAFAADPPPERGPVFGGRSPDPPPAGGPDVFSLYSRGAHAEPPPPPRPPPPEPPRRASSPAVQRFDRGLELLGAKLYELALAEWEEACRLDPSNRLYQTNLKRLRAQIAARAQSHPTESE